ncbi:SDR family NAD(P)-dependent oxidoreductase [Streptomyces sp. ME02-8801-2C]|uniref:SDR family NAD(P)-dependent oxidoreductase n=1 Tax=Streptomyces sp. ME02-8801-2C TaxID=3028680 RepID=UPI0029BDAFC9|nr:SDR family NAD(P)-dependent oxidoreductase [Streptomyces sp. ME02-8801-2C]MDX3453313.1 SDR family NAD(P)-dependent oxidoreductase [Streptomyces sp. ME02-8801-2C]
MSKVIAVFGAGTGLGASVARRFGREGFRVALVARRKQRLETLVAQLADEGIAAVAFPADLSEPAEVPALVEAIRDRFGRIDVVEYGPFGGTQSFVPAVALDAATLENLSKLFLLTPVEVFHAVLPEMRERGDGAVLMTTGYSAVQPMAHLSGPGPVMSAARNYLYSLNAELADTGVYAGTLTIAALIAGSESAATSTAPADAPADADVAGPAIPTVHPDQLAEHYWDMYTRRDRVELAHPVELTPQASAAA